MARSRDLTADARDRAARARDESADRYEVTAAERARAATAAGDLDDVRGRLEALRQTSAFTRRQAALERQQAAADRAAAARDRRDAAAERKLAGIDELTGIFRRGTGELAIVHEIERARRTGGSLVLAMIDVDSLKSVNDSRGHAAGDQLLHVVATAITETLRAYDVTVRWGGDEFLCAISGVTTEVAAERLAEIQRALGNRQPSASVSIGRAELQDDDTLESLIARADAELYRGRAEHAA